MGSPDDSSPHLLVEKRDGIAYVTLNRPDKRNAFSPEMLVRLCDAWVDIAADPSIRVVLLTGAGDGVLVRRRPGLGHSAHDAHAQARRRMGGALRRRPQATRRCDPAQCEVLQAGRRRHQRPRPRGRRRVPPEHRHPHHVERSDDRAHRSAARPDRRRRIAHTARAPGAVGARDGVGTRRRADHCAACAGHRSRQSRRTAEGRAADGGRVRAQDQSGRAGRVAEVEGSDRAQQRPSARGGIRDRVAMHEGERGDRRREGGPARVHGEAAAGVHGTD